MRGRLLRSARRASTIAAAGALVAACHAGPAMAMTGAPAPAGTPVRGTQRETIELWLAGRERAAQRFVDAASTPGSSGYRRFLSPAAYTRRFGPSAAEVRATRAFLIGEGFGDVRASVNDDYVSASAPVATVDRAFAVRMRRYRQAGPGSDARTLETNDRALTVPAAIGRELLAVTGLDDGRPQAHDASTPADPRGMSATASPAACSRFWAQRTHAVSPAYDGLTEAAIPVCGYSARQIRAAYGLSPSDTGAGETIAIVLDGEPNDQGRALTDYANANGLPAPRPGQYRQQFVTAGPHRRRCLDGGIVEGPIDTEAAYAAAPRANQLVVVGNDCDTREDGNEVLLDALLAPLTGRGSRPSAQIESVSYGFGAEASPSVVRAAHAIALRAAAEGVSLLVSTGDSPGVDAPSTDPDLTAVGGTTLGIGADRRRLFETGWSDGIAKQTVAGGPWTNDGIELGGGGGLSSVYREPEYQRGVVPARLARDRAGRLSRALPDISADADLFSGLRYDAFARDGAPTPFTYVQAGTSTATPLVAGMVADAERGARRPFGFLNPLLYSLAGRPAFHDILPVRPSSPALDRAVFIAPPTGPRPATFTGVLGILDTQTPGETRQVTAHDYDTMTGLGTPNGSAFMTALRSGT